MPVISVDIESNRPVIAANLEELRYLVFHGMKGDTGQSAYDLAVELGFEGTEAEWLASLRGPQGEQGIQGEPGPPGERGLTGATGADGKNYGIVVDGSVDNILELKSVEVDETSAVVAVSPVASNDPTKVAELVSVAQSYYDNRLDNGVSRFVYSQDYTIHNSDNIFVLGNIACNVFADLVLRGIPYAESPYGVAYAAGMPKGTTYNEHYSEYTGLAAYSSNNLGYNNTYPWALNPWDWMSGSEREAETGRDVESKVANAAQLAQLLTEIGDVVPITEDYSYIEPGDFLFWAMKGTGGVWRHPNRYLHISHVAVCTGIEEGKHAYIEVSKSAEDAGADSTVHKDYVETSTLHPKGRLVLVCRPKLGRAVLTPVIVSQPQDIEARAGASVVMSVGARGEGLTYQWQYKNAGSSTWSDASAGTAKTANYSFSVDANRDGRQIRCVVSAHGKSVNSRAATLRVIDTAPAANSDKLITSGGVHTALSGKQNALTFDSTPTQGSSNPVTSDGVYTALAAKQDTLTVDSTPAQDHTNPVSSGGVYTALATKQNLLTAGTGITIDSNNVISASGGGGSSGWRQLTASEFGFMTSSGQSTNVGSISSEAYYCAALGIVRFSLTITTSGAIEGSQSDPKEQRIAFDTNLHYKPYFMGGSTVAVGVLAVPFQAQGLNNRLQNAYITRANASSNDPYISVVTMASISSGSSRSFSGFYYTEDIPSS